MSRQGQLCENITSSTKLEVHNVSHAARGGLIHGHGQHGHKVF